MLFSLLLLLLLLLLLSALLLGSGKDINSVGPDCPIFFPFFFSLSLSNDEEARNREEEVRGGGDHH